MTQTKDFYFKTQTVKILLEITNLTFIEHKQNPFIVIVKIIVLKCEQI